jgi:hypothetical protein
MRDGQKWAEGTNQPPHSPDLALGDFNLYRPMKVPLGRRKFQIGDGHKRYVLNCICSQDKAFYTSVISNVSRPRKIYVRVKGEHVEEE